MVQGISAVLALAKIKAAIVRFERGETNATDTLAAIVQACKVAKSSARRNRGAA